MGFNHEGEPACDGATFDAWADADFANLRFESRFHFMQVAGCLSALSVSPAGFANRARYNRRMETFRRKIEAANATSKTGEVGVVFLLMHYEHPTELCAAIEARWPLLRFVILTVNLIGKYPSADTLPEHTGDEYAVIIDELEDELTAREIASELSCRVSFDCCGAALLHGNFDGKPVRFSYQSSWPPFKSQHWRVDDRGGGYLNPR